MSYMFNGARAFASDVSAWVRHLWPTMFRRVNTFQLYGFTSQVCFPIKNTHAIAHAVWKLMTSCETTGSRMSPKSCTWTGLACSVQSNAAQVFDRCSEDEHPLIPVSQTSCCYLYGSCLLLCKSFVEYIYTM